MLSEIKGLYWIVANNESIPWGLVSFILASLIAILLYVKSNKKRKPFFLVKNLSLFEDKVDSIDSLQINYDGKVVNHFSVAHVAIWNAGDETISKGDVAPASKVRIVADNNVEIIGAKVVFVANKANNFSVRLLEKPKRRIGVYFDYFDKNEGVIIQIFHTGKLKESIKVEGSIKNAGIIKNSSSGLAQNFTDTIKFLTGEKLLKKAHFKYRRVILGFVTFVVPFFPLLSIIFPSISEPLNLKSSLILSFLLALIYWPAGFFLIKRRVPKEFSVFEEM